MTDDDLPPIVRAELTRLRAERAVHVAERERLLEQLATADTNLRAAIDRHHELRAESDLTAQLRERAAEAEALERDVATARRERDGLRAELRDTRAERDRLRVLLLDAELELHGRPPAEPQPAGGEATALAVRLAAAEAAAAEATRELEATRATVSWRVTRPLRWVRRLTR